MKPTDKRTRFTLDKALTATLCLAIALFALPAHAVTNELVGSAESHSIEKFNSKGTWIQTFASTGPYYPLGIAASPTTEDVFAVTLTGTILRYTKTGASFGPGGSYWSTFNMSSLIGSNALQALLFDSSGNLYVATNYGESAEGYTVEIYRFSASQLSKATPEPSGSPIITTIEQGGQMAWDADGNICMASWYAPQGAQCYNTHTGALAYDYSSEFLNQGIQPVGLAFGAGNILTVSSIFIGQVFSEAAARIGPLDLVATGTVQPAEVGFLAVDSFGNLYLPEWHNVAARLGTCVPPLYSCMDFDFSSDIVYKIDPTTGVITNFIGNHLWGPNQMIFVSF
jgi:hypothetical protein